MQSSTIKGRRKILAFSLTFSDPSLEKGFAANKVKGLVHALRWWTLGVLMFFLASMVLLHRYWDADQYQTREQLRVHTHQLVYQCLAVGQLLATFLVVELLNRYRKLGAFGIEIVIVCSTAAFLGSACMNMSHYFTVAWGYPDTAGFWGVEMGGTDAALLMGIDVCLSVLHLVIPVRWKFLVPIQVISILSYVVPAYALGSPDSRMVPGNVLGLASLAALASLGKRRTERKERLEFRALLMEKARRFEAEFQLSQAPVIPSRIDAGDGTSDAGPPSTTATGRVFNAGSSNGISFDHMVCLGQKEHWVIGEDEVQLAPEILGEGGFGVVARGFYHGAEVALKTPKPAENASEATPDALIELCNELRVLRLLRHPRIVSLYGAVLHPSSATLCLVLEMIHGKPLTEFLQTRSGCELVTRAQLLVDTASALRYLHTRRPAVVHGDLKDNNIFVERSSGGEFRSKLLDFGLSRQLTRHARSLGGTLRWVAPEVLAMDGPPQVSADVFSLGRLMYLFSTGQVPFAGIYAKELRSRVRRSPTLQWPESRDGALARFLRPLAEQCMQHVAQLRPCILEVGHNLSGILHELRDGSTGGERRGGSEGPASRLSVFTDFMFEQEPSKPIAVTTLASPETSPSVPKAQPSSTEDASPLAGSSGTAGADQRGAGSDGGQSQRPHRRFPHTPDHTISMSLGLLMMQWNHELPIGSCCWMHAASKKAEAVLSDLSGQPCDGWEVPVSGQCSCCKLLRIEGGPRTCAFCQEEVPE